MSDISTRIDDAWHYFEMIRESYEEYIKDIPISEKRRNQSRIIYKVLEDMENILTEIRELRDDEALAEELHDSIVSKKPNSEFVI